MPEESEARVVRQKLRPPQRLVRQPRTAKGSLAVTAGPALLEWQPRGTVTSLQEVLVGERQRARVFAGPSMQWYLAPLNLQG